jgi:hypothetical protein
MKLKLRFMHSYSIIFLIVVAIASCQKKNCAADLPGKWTLVSHTADQDKIVENLKSEVNAQELQQMIASGSLDESVKSIIQAHATVEFTTDGKCTYAHQKSTDYSISKDCKQIFFSSSPGGKEQYTILQLTDQVLDLEYLGVRLNFKKNG